MATTTKPEKLTIRAYQVGFGDCFLLTFHYPNARNAADQKRHILIDFGSTEMPHTMTSAQKKGQMLRVAEDIRQQCGGAEGKLHIVVATHRHKDHISGFNTEGETNTGTIIRELKPEVVIQPWTERPDAPIDPTALSALPKNLPKSARGARSASLQAMFAASLDDMSLVSEAALSEIDHLNGKMKFKQASDVEVIKQIDFIGKDNLKNLSAVENLMTMGSKPARYVNHGYNFKIKKLLPGVNVHVLGPPTLEQSAKIKKQRAKDDVEFWMLQAAASRFWSIQSATGGLVKKFIAGETRLFPGAETFKDSIPPHNRWFIRRMRSARASQLLGVVRILDSVLNNTSLILLFEAGDKKFLFPGDAQIENWEFALSNPDDMALLKNVNLYKVGHHGSRNATPKTLWNHFENKKSGDAPDDPSRIKSLISTMKGNKHGDEANNSEVPRRTLEDELKNFSDYRSTEETAQTNELCIEIEYPL